MPSVSQLATLTTSASGLSNLVLVTPQKNVGIWPQLKSGTTADQEQPSPIIFNYEGEQTDTMESDITDHFIEDNTAIQNQISLKPITITTHGFIAELNDVVPKELEKLQTAAQKLTLIGGFVPSLSVAALLAFNEATLLYNTAKKAAEAAVEAYRGLPRDTQTKQQIVYGQFKGYWSERRLFTVQTPWALYFDMAIKSLRAIQAEDTRVITDFEVTFKQMNFTQSIFNDTSGQSEGRLSMQASPVRNLGVNRPPISGDTFSSKLGG